MNFLVKCSTGFLQGKWSGLPTAVRFQSTETKRNFSFIFNY